MVFKWIVLDPKMAMNIWLIISSIRKRFSFGSFFLFFLSLSPSTLNYQKCIFQQRSNDNEREKEKIKEKTSGRTWSIHSHGYDLLDVSERARVCVILLLWTIWEERRWWSNDKMGGRKAVYIREQPLINWIETLLVTYTHTRARARRNVASRLRIFYISDSD